MKQIINGKLYNTATATVVAEWNNGRCGGYSEEVETLYRTPKGAYFVYGYGGPMSSYRRQVETNSWAGSAAIRVLDDAGLRAWLEEKADADTYLAVVGSAVEA